MHTGSALSSNPTSLACVAQGLIGTSVKDSPSSEEFKSGRVSNKESRRFGAWSEGKEIKTPFSLHCRVALNLRNKSLSRRFAGEKLEIRYDGC